MKKMMRLLSRLLGIGALVMFLLAGTLNLRMGGTIGLVMLMAAAVIALVIAFIEGDGGTTLVPTVCPGHKPGAEYHRTQERPMLCAPRDDS